MAMDTNGDSTRQVVEELLAFLPILSAPDFQPCEWQGGDHQPDGSITMPYPVYHPEVDRLFRVYSTIWVHPYELLPGDPPNFDITQFVVEPTYFQTSTFDQT